jgi:hypothetical protein
VSQYVVSSDARHIDRELVWRFLHDEAYWSAGIPRDVLDRAIDGSVAFARVVTDRATFAWLCDVFVVAEQRGKASASSSWTW